MFDMLLSTSGSVFHLSGHLDKLKCFNGTYHLHFTLKAHHVSDVVLMLLCKGDHCVSQGVYWLYLYPVQGLLCR